MIRDLQEVRKLSEKSILYLTVNVEIVTQKGSKSDLRLLWLVYGERWVLVEDEVREVRVIGKVHAGPTGHCKDCSFYSRWFYELCQFEQS